MRTNLPLEPEAPPRLSSFRVAFRQAFGCAPSNDRPCAPCLKAPSCAWPRIRDALDLDAFPVDIRPFILLMLGIDAEGRLAELPNLYTDEMAQQLGCPSRASVMTLVHAVGLSRDWRLRFRRHHDPQSLLHLPPTARRYIRLVTGLDHDGHLANDPMTAFAASRLLGRSKNAASGSLAYWNLNYKTIRSILRSQFSPDALADDEDDAQHVDLRARFYGDQRK